MKRICAKGKNWGRDTRSDIARVGVLGKFEKKMNCLGLKSNFADMI
jgi:hypothetical protein